MLVYPTLYDHLTKYTYLVKVPSWIDGDYEEVLDGFLAPIISADQNTTSEMQYSRRSISSMIEFLKKDAYFTIVDDQDVLEIKHYLEAFVLDELAGTAITEEVIEFMKYASELHKRLVTLSVRILRKNRTLREYYFKNSRKISGIQTAMTTNGMDMSAPIAAGLTKLPDITSPNFRKSNYAGTPFTDYPGIENVYPFHLYS